MRKCAAFFVCIVLWLPAVGSAGEGYPRPELLIEPAALAKDAAAYLVLDARPKIAYDAGHVPGAVWVDHAAWEKAFHAGEGRDVGAWEMRIGALGVTGAEPVVVYDDNLSKDAARIWWILKYFDVGDARLLNGGWKGWAAEGRPVSKETTRAAASDFKAAPQAERQRGKSDVLALLKNGGGVQIVDARSEAEHCGDEPLKNAKVGAIPGAKQLEWSDLLDKQSGRFKPADELKRLFTDAGIDPKKPAVTHCQSGGRASVMAFGLELMGGERVANYYRGWSEWGNSEGTPVAKVERSKGATPGTDAVGPEKKRPPNVVFVMADDLGVGELGCYGQKVIKTPRIDGLAGQGMRFTQAYSGFPVCAPARCTLMTGKHAGHSYIRDNGNPPGRTTDEAAGLFPGQHPIPDEAVTVAELFKARGYATGAMGKWGLGYEGSSGDPVKQGFDLFLGYICQVHAHNHYPRFLWRDTAAGLEKVAYAADPKEPDGLLGTTYSEDEFIREAKAFVTANKDRPFFLYMPIIVTHLSLQIPDDEPSLAEYQKTIAEGEFKDGDKHYRRHRTPRAAYAAMVTRMDRGIGEVVDLVDSLGLGENTIVVFTSDNGPTFGRLAGADSTFFDSTEGRRGRKGSVYEGGIREPLVVRWTGHVPAGTTSDLPTYFPDWLPTLLDLTGDAAAIPADIDGVSIAPTLLGKPEAQKRHEFLYWEFRPGGGQQAVRAGNWKAVRQNMAQTPAGQTPKTELYDLASDPAESKDVAAEHPDVVARLEAVMAAQHVPSKLFPLPGIDPVKKPAKPKQPRAAAGN